MNELDKKLLDAAIKTHLKDGRTTIKRKNFVIYKEVYIARKYYNVIELEKNCRFVESKKGKFYFIEMNDYLITVSAPSVPNPECIDFSTARIYNLKTAQEVENNTTGKVNVKNITIVDKKILAIITDKKMPHYFIFINDALTEIKSFCFEELIYSVELNKTHQESLKKFYPEENWEEHNGLLIDKDNLSVPSRFQLLLWKKKRNVSAKIPAPMSTFDFFHCYTTQSSKPAIRYISSTNI